MPKAVSFNPATFSKGGLAEGVYTITRAELEKRDGTYGEQVTLVMHCADSEGNEYPGWYNVGKTEKTGIDISDDGKELLVPDDSEYRMSLRSACGKLFQSLVEAGFDPSDFDNLTKLEGLEVTLKAIGSGNKSATGEEKTILLVDKIHNLKGSKPGVKTAAKPAAAAKKAATPAKAAEPEAEADSDELETEAIGAVAEVLAGLGDGAHSTKTVQTKVFMKLREDKAKRDEVNKLLNTPAFWEAGEAAEVWAYDAKAKTVATA